MDQLFIRRLSAPESEETPPGRSSRLSATAIFALLPQRPLVGLWWIIPRAVHTEVLDRRSGPLPRGSGPDEVEFATKFAALSCCLSAADIRFSGHSSPAEELDLPHSRPTGRFRTSTGLSRSARASCDRIGRPLQPRDGGALLTASPPWPAPAASQRPVLLAPLPHSICTSCLFCDDPKPVLVGLPQWGAQTVLIFSILTPPG